MLPVALLLVKNPCTCLIVRDPSRINPCKSHKPLQLPVPLTQTLHIPYERRTNMKRVGLWMIGIGLFITVGLITVKQGYAEEEEHAPTCTKATLKGRYLFAADSTHLPPLTPNIQARAGYRIFHG